MAGDAETGVSIMRMREGLDTGPVCLARPVHIGPDTTAGMLHDELAALGAELMAEALAGLEAGSLVCRPQPEAGVTYARKIEKSEARIDFTRPAGEVVRHIHGLSPHPGAWFALPLGERTVRVKALRAVRAPGSGMSGAAIGDDLTIACGSGAVRLLELQREGKAPMPADVFLRGTPVPAGADLSGVA